jgi:hypothetical protein
MSDPKKKDPAKAPVPTPKAEDSSTPLGGAPDESPPPVETPQPPPPAIRVTRGENGTVTNEIGGGS